MIKVDGNIDLEALSSGDTKAFDLLFTSYYPKVKSFLRNMLNDENEAEDLAQEAFIRLWQSRNQLSNVKNLNAYIYQTVKNILYTYLEKRKDIFMSEIDDNIDAVSNEDIENIVFYHELEELINKTINDMPLQRKRVFYLSRWKGLNINDISLKLGISKRTVETHISLALANLRKVVLGCILILFC